MTVADKIKYDYGALVRNYATVHLGHHPQSKLNFNMVNATQKAWDGKLLRAGGMYDSQSSLQLSFPQHLLTDRDQLNGLSDNQQTLLI